MDAARSRWAIPLVVVGLALPALGQAPAAGAPAQQGQPPLQQEELDQLLAPIALYPDAVVSQILMASTYPLEIVEAGRWAQANAQLQGDALASALQQQSWDPSVKSLINFPQVLTMLSQHLDSTVKLGDAFLGQQKQVMSTIQSLRRKAMAQGTLQSGDQQIVAQSNEGGTSTIVIQPTNPSTIYVPVYDPSVVYGSWSYPAYPPYDYRPPGYGTGSAWAFGTGVAVGAAWGYAWGSCNWHGGDIDIDVNQHTELNRSIDRAEYQNRVGAGGTWRHDVEHRQGVAYRDSQTAQRYGSWSSAQDLQARQAFRGRAEGLESGGSGPWGSDGMRADGLGGGAFGTNAARNAGRDTLGGAEGGGAWGGAGGDRGGALSGIDRGGNFTMASSMRGAASRGWGGGGRFR
jgi:hypothetical protein